MISQSGKVVNINNANGDLRAKSCLFVNNLESGRAKNRKKVDICDVEALFDHPVSVVAFDGTQDIDGYPLVLVCGGDGTISNAVNAIHSSSGLLYLPSGTVNDFGKIKRKEDAPLIVGRANEKRFCYVLATGTFTSIGYDTKRKYKKRIGKLAYLIRAIKEFRIQRIKGIIKADGKSIEGEFTLVMILRSPRCFGFSFNKMYRDEPELYLLTISSPKRNGIIGLAELFFLFFRSFFIGFRKEKDGKIKFLPCKDVTFNFDGSADFCLDGEKYVAENEVKCFAETTPIELKILKKIKRSRG